PPAARRRALARPPSPPSLQPPAQPLAGVPGFPSGVRHWSHSTLFRPPPCRRGPGLEGGAVGHAEEPVAHLLARPDRGGLVDEDEEGGLERILGVVVVSEDTAAHTQHHRAVPGQQRLEGGLVPPGDEPLQQLAVRRADPAGHLRRPAQPLQDPVHGTGCHVACFPGPPGPSFHVLPLLPGRGVARRFFRSHPKGKMASGDFLSSHRIRFRLRDGGLKEKGDEMKRRWTSRPARRPSAGAVPGRRGLAWREGGSRCGERGGLIARWAQGNLRKLLRSDTPGARLEQSPVQNSSPSIDRGEEAALLATVAAWWTSASPTAQPLTAAGPPGLGVARAGAAGSTP